LKHPIQTSNTKAAQLDFDEKLLTLGGLEGRSETTMNYIHTAAVEK
jgi:hypothetical protein